MTHLLLGGDAMLGRGVDQVVQDEGPGYPLEALAPLIGQADLFWANLECAITPQPLRYSGPPKAFYFRATPPAVRVLARAQVSLVSAANNHALDAGLEGLLDTLALLDDHGIAWAGAGLDEASAHRPAIVVHDTVRLGVLAYCDHQADFAAGPARPGIAYVDVDDPASVDRLVREVGEAARQVDHLVVALHWLPNWVPEVPESYRHLARRLVGAGARIIWGHSPHHFLGVEWIENNVVLYSAGDLVNDYALEPSYRNDRQLLFLAEIILEGIAGVQAYPIQLGFARTQPADPAAHDWIAERLAYFCSQVASRVRPTEGRLSILPA